MAASDNCGIELGRLVSSKAGRDRGRYYLIYEVLSDRFVRVVDGRIRRIENPKPKNIKHLCFHPKVAEEVAAKLRQGERVTNAEIREALERLISSPEGGA
ncbi:KOW domain-containing RNA-binding protein [Ammonifex thiophilus]|uniref:RNA-binding protein n=1 Tax=Ammonifex thiophilus TaxID=444093 RepID=A0A3D8P585_9THEO|nr:KOW domain-containing RNA-binding protein [Ammonifex thiophilus]RDV83382.1 RNA-binding protein [Ammonifex thiophilus]